MHLFGTELASFLQTAEALSNRVEESLELIFEASEYLECVHIGVVQLLACGFSGFAQVGGSSCISFSNGLTCTRFCIDQHLLASLLRVAEDGTLFDEPFPFSLRILKGPLCDVVCIVRDLVARFEDLLSLSDIGWYG